jgi:mRNA interferase RelE/StbE
LTLYSVELSRQARKAIRALNQPALRRRILERIEGFARDPRPRGCDKLTGTDDMYRVRQGDYRILYTISDTVLVVEVVDVGHRSDVYR